jgi:hypothetical protein
VTHVTTDETTEPTALSAADERVLRELTERARAGGLKLTHDITAARELVLPGLRPWLAVFPCLADSGYAGAGCGVLVPVKSPARAISILTQNAATCCCAAGATSANAASPS